MVLLLQTYTLNWGKFLFGVMLGKRTFHFTQKSKIKASRPPGDFFVLHTSLAPFLCLTLKHAVFFMYSQCSLSLGSREKPGWTLPYGQRRVTRKWELSSLLGVQSTGSCLSSSPRLVCSGLSSFLLLHILFSLVLFHDTDFDLPSPCILHKFPFIILRDLLSPSENDKICDAPRMTKYC